VATVVVVPVGVESFVEPRPCAKTGVLTTDVLVKAATRTPRWIGLLLLFGVWPYLIAAYFTRHSAKVAVPFCNQAWDRYLRKWKFARNSMVGSAALTVLFLAIFRAQPPWVGLVGLGCFLLALGFAKERTRKHVRLSSQRQLPDGDAVTRPSVIRRRHGTPPGPFRSRLKLRAAVLAGDG
jgi:hypothetical protein